MKVEREAAWGKENAANRAKANSLEFELQNLKNQQDAELQAESDALSRLSKLRNQLDGALHVAGTLHVGPGHGGTRSPKSANQGAPPARERPLHAARRFGAQCVPR